MKRSSESLILPIRNMLVEFNARDIVEMTAGFHIAITNSTINLIEHTTVYRSNRSSKTSTQSVYGESMSGFLTLSYTKMPNTGSPGMNSLFRIYMRNMDVWYLIKKLLCMISFYQHTHTDTHTR
jgi:hypothetical protein